MNLVKGFNMELIEKVLKEHKKSVVAFSGGKDSTVVLDLVRNIDNSVPAVFCDTGVEAKETYQYIKRVNNIITLKPRKTFWQCIDEYGYPEIKSKSKSHGNRCCFWLKEEPMNRYIKEYNIDLMFTGLTSDESNSRKLFFMHRGNYMFVKSQNVWKCHPIHDFSEKDVWDYINSNNLDYNELYDKGAKRTGCQPCTAYCNWKKNLARENPRLLAFILQKRFNQRQLEIENI